MRLNARSGASGKSVSTLSYCRNKEMIQFRLKPLGFDRSRPWLVNTAVTLLLAVLLLLSWGLRQWRVAQVQMSLHSAQEDAVTDALALIDERFAALQGEMIDRAKQIAESPAIIEGLRIYESSGPAHNSEVLVEYFSNLDLDQREAVSLYDRVPRLIAWNGFSMPLDDAPNGVRFLETYQTAIADDGRTRQALVVWWPVRYGGRSLGVVRVMQLIRFDAPVQNRYLDDYNIAETWSNLTNLPVEVSFGSLETDPHLLQGYARVLQGVDGTILGRVFVKPPTPEILVQMAASRASDLMAFWATLLLFWLMAGIWRWYVHHKGSRFIRFVIVAFAWWGLRFMLLALDVPARWQPGKAPLSPLFDPTHLASTFGYGLMRSTGDLLITSIFALLFAVALLHPASLLLERTRTYYLTKNYHGGGKERKFAFLGFLISVTGATVLLLGLAYLVGVTTHHAILDSTHDYLARSGLFPEQPERLIVAVFCSLLLLMLSAVVAGVAIIWAAQYYVVLNTRHKPRWWAAGLAVLFMGLTAGVAYIFLDMQDVVPWPGFLAFVITGITVTVFNFVREGRGLELLSLRGVLLSIFLLTLLLYPVFYRGMDLKRRMQMVDAVESFDIGRDPRVVYAIEQVLKSASTSSDVRGLFVSEENEERSPLSADSLAREFLRGSLLISLGPYDVSLAFVDPEGRVLGSYYEGEQPASRATLSQDDSGLFEMLKAMYAENDSTGILVEQLTGRVERERVQYAGLVPLNVRTSPSPIGWIVARAEPQTLIASNETPFPRVLLPAGDFGNLHASLSLAHFRNGVLVRSFGRDFGRYRLAEPVRQALHTTRELWLEETVEGRQYLTYYRKQEAMLPTTLSSIVLPTSMSVVAVRAPALNMFDHLYYLLRLTVAGLLIGFPLYLIGLAIRRKAGLLPAVRVRFRDKVLNAFLAVGTISVAVVGFLGEEVVTGGTEGTVRNWLALHLERVEEALILEAEGDELPYHVLNRTHIDSLAARVGLDLNLYKGYHLLQSSRPQLERDGLIDKRLPIEAYKALYFDGQHFVVTEERVGTFEYRAGFRVLLDEEGLPGYVISLPTLPEQERLEEEQARTLAYLFGALLLLVLAVMLTASLLANAIARPIGRLRVGLEAVAKGQFERSIPVGTRDEIGELVQTFNTMQQQLAESRRILAQQERQLAWREMARQIAHEIKNPLTPMKLSVQHLRRAYDSLHAAQNGSDSQKTARFDGIFERITTTLIEQIDSLARIANEFHSFARMPSRILERLDLNRVIMEAVSLMQADTDVKIVTNIAAEPLIVEADHEELRRTFINLIKNAAEAIPEDVEGCITITSELRIDEESNTRIAYSSVSDNGTGIPVELRGKIFEPNFSTKTRGTGLGLAIASKSIEDFKGKIDFETHEHIGTTFWIELPIVD